MEKMIDKENQDINSSNEILSLKKRKEDTVCIPEAKRRGVKKNVNESLMNEEDALKIERIKRIIEQEKDMADIRQVHENNITAIKEDFHKEWYALEIREATAKAELAELQLQREKEKVRL